MPKREAWNCEDPNHEGDRYVFSVHDQYARRVEYMRSDQQKRLATITQARLCKDCALRDIEWRKTNPNMMNPYARGLQQALPVDPQAPLGRPSDG